MAVALAVYEEKQNFWATGREAAALRSQTFFQCTVSTKTDSIELPVQTCTTVAELKEVIATYIGYIEETSFDFVVKQGCTFKKLQPCAQIQKKMTVIGLKDFKPFRHKYKHPYGIIGGGYMGLKTALFLEHYGSQDYVIFDRYDRVGGHCWLEMANKTTRLQTEWPCFHMWMGKEFSHEGVKWGPGPPKDWEIWPKRDRVLEGFQICYDEFGILPHLHLGTNVSEMEVFGKLNDIDRYYELTADPVTYERKDVQGGGALKHQHYGEASNGDAGKSEYFGERDTTRESFKTQVSCIAMWPGALVFPRQVVYPGEENFGGPMDYAVEMRYDYRNVPGNVVCIIGHGAFTMENIRTCLENRCKHIYLLCRKMNLTCPRPASWFVNQADPPMSAAQLLDMISHAYKHVRCDGKPVDPWDIHSVMANKERKHATIIQKTRFGIGDVYFLASAYGLLDIVIGEVKRCTHRTLHLNTGRKLECDTVLKCTGCVADWKVDKLLKIKEMVGLFVNGDVRRHVTGEADGINASQFSLTTVGPAAIGMVKTMLHFWDVPKEWQRLIDTNVVGMLPVHRAGEPDPEFPAYFVTARHAQGGGMVLSEACPLLQKKQEGDGQYKKYIQHLCAPQARLIAEAKADWEYYEAHFREQGMVAADAPYVPYLFDVDYMGKQDRVHQEYVRKRYGA